MSRAQHLISRLNEVKQPIHPIKHCRTCDVYGDEEKCPECGEIMEVIGVNSLGGMPGYGKGML